MLNSSKLSLVKDTLYQLIVDYADYKGGWYHNLPYDLWHTIQSSNEFEDEYIKLLLNNIKDTAMTGDCWVLEVDNEFSFIPLRTFKQLYEDWLDNR